MKKVLLFAVFICVAMMGVSQHDTHEAVTHKVELTAYPNPFVESVTVSTSFESGYVNIYDLEGKCVFTEKFGSHEFELGLGALSGGIFFMVVYCEDEQNKAVIKIVK